MFDETSAFHHIEIHTRDPNCLLDLFERIYDFQLIAKRRTSNYAQWFIESTHCRIMISSVWNFDQNDQMKDHYDILTSILSDESTRDLILHRETVFNVALQVKSVQSILEQNSDLKVLVSSRYATDKYGTIEYACIRSCIGNVLHTLIDTSQYSGPFLPGFLPVFISGKSRSHQTLVNDIDHVAFAMPRHSALPAILWYEKVFGMKRLILNSEDDPFRGFAVRVGTKGMRLFASEYWKCAETACVNSEKSNLKFVFAESLIDENSNSTDQITTFISHHQNQAGIQHIGFSCMKNIKDVVRITKRNGADFLAPCANYYLKQNNGLVIESAGENVDDLAELGILLDDEGDQAEKKILLQIFSRSIFNNETFFLELIERRGGANGFGAGNIRALWKSMEEKLPCEV